MKCARCISMARGGHGGNTYMQCHRCIMPIGMEMPSAGHDALAFQHKNMTKFDKKICGCCRKPRYSCIQYVLNY